MNTGRYLRITAMVSRSYQKRCYLMPHNIPFTQGIRIVYTFGRCTRLVLDKGHHTRKIRTRTLMFVKCSVVGRGGVEPSTRSSLNFRSTSWDTIPCNNVSEFRTSYKIIAPVERYRTPTLFSNTRRICICCMIYWAFHSIIRQGQYK